MAIIGQFLRFPRNFGISHDRLGPGIRHDLTALIFRDFMYQPDFWWVDAQYSEADSFWKWLGQFFHVRRKLISLDQLSGRRWMISHYGLKFGTLMQHTVEHIIIWNGHTQPMFPFSAGRGRCHSLNVLCSVLCRLRFAEVGDTLPCLSHWQVWDAVVILYMHLSDW